MSVHTTAGTPYDGDHAPDGWRGICCAHCTRVANTCNGRDVGNHCVSWPCEPVKERRRAAGLREYDARVEELTL